MTLTEEEIDARAIAYLIDEGWTPDIYNLTPGSRDREYLERTFAWQRARLAVQLEEIKREVTASLHPALARVVWRLFVWQAWIERRRDDVRAWHERRRFRRRLKG